MKAYYSNKIQKKKILFIKIGSFSNTNESILNILVSNFPEYEIEVVDLLDGILKHRTIKNVIYALKEYGWRMLLSKKSIQKSLLYNKYIFYNVKRRYLNKFSQNQYFFTFQTQSIFDMSINGIPHFLYTDHTLKENYRYPGYDKRNILDKTKWVKYEKTIYDNATLNFTMSSNITSSIINDYNCDPKTVKCVYAGYNTTKDTNESIYRNKKYKKNILFVGIDWERKGGPLLVEAFKKVSLVHPDASLTIVGSSPKIDINNCNIIGKVPLAEVQKYYEEADIFCLPTNLEPFGLVFLEAMNNKLAVIGTDIGAIPDFIINNKNGFRINPNDLNSLVEKLLILLDSPLLCTEFGEYSYKIIKEKYKWEKVGEKIKQNITENLTLKQNKID